MKRKNLLFTIMAAIMLIACPMAAFAEGAEETVKMAGTFWALVPPVIAIALALITKEVYSSLFVGIVVGGLFASNFKIIGAVDNIVNEGIIAAVSGIAGIFVFLVVLGGIVALVNKAGGSAAFGEWAKKNIKSRVGAMLATFLLGVLIFIDDYFNCLTVGSVMRPVTDAHKISRAKLSYLIDATAAPICMIAPISSWAAAVSEFAPEGQGLALFIRAIPYNFYSLLTLVFIIALALMKFDFGPMKRAEEAAASSAYEEEQSEQEEVMEVSDKGTTWDLVIPMLVLISCSILGMAYVGGFFSGVPFSEAIGVHPTAGLTLGAFAALIIAMIMYLPRKLMTFREFMEGVSLSAVW